MKTVVDAVNELRADATSGKYTTWVGTERCSHLGFDDDGDWVSCSPRYGGKVCSLEEFNQCVAEMSAWQPVIKVSNVETVNVGGKIYEIGGLYIGYDNSLIRLDGFSNGEFLGVDTSGNSYQNCWLIAVSESSEFPDSKLGKITPAPVEVVDGGIYKFYTKGQTLFGVKDGDYLVVDRYQKYSIEMCSDITRLVPEAQK